MRPRFISCDDSVAPIHRRWSSSGWRPGARPLRARTSGACGGGGPARSARADGDTGRVEGQLFGPHDEGPKRTRTASRSDAPLPVRMRPKTRRRGRREQELLGDGAPLRRAMRRAARLDDFHGPPGSGKTTLARLVAATAGAAIEELSAVEVSQPRGARGPRARRAPAARPAASRPCSPRRDPPLGQDPAGLAPPRGGGEAGHAAHRGDDREPVLRGQLRARLARSGVRAAAADRGERRGAPAPRDQGMGGGGSRRQEAIAFLGEGAGGDARVALGAFELASEDGGDGADRPRARPDRPAAARDPLRQGRRTSTRNTPRRGYEATRDSDPTPRSTTSR